MTDDTHTNRRGFLRTGAMGGLAAGAAIAASAVPAKASGGPTKGDIDILQFLCAAEQIETDLWQQYLDYASTNEEYREALRSTLDRDVVDYTSDTTADERSHDEFIAAYLKSIGVKPVDLTPFKTIRGPDLRGQPKHRLTNLTSLSVDTSYYTRYRYGLNPDLGDTPPQIATIVNQSSIPTSGHTPAKDLIGLAGVAGLHFASIEQGGSSLYNTLLLQISSVEALRIVSSIYATEAVHFAVFNDILGNYPGHDNGKGTLVIPNLQGIKQRSSHVMAGPTKFLRADLPQCSVIRPGTTANSGAVAAATGLVKSNLFLGQSSAFFSAVVALAKAADAAKREI